MARLIGRPAVITERCVRIPDVRVANGQGVRAIVVEDSCPKIAGDDRVGDTQGSSMDQQTDAVITKRTIDHRHVAARVRTNGTIDA